MSRWLLAVLAVAGLPACGGREGTTATGTVTYQARPVPLGFITFHAAKGPEAPKGAKIVNGQFTVTDLTPGAKRVQVRSDPATYKREGQPNPAKEAPVIPSDALGNFQVVEVAPGVNRFEFALHRPKR